MRDSFANALIAAMRDDPRIVVLDGDVANSTKTDQVFHAFPERFVACGIAEQNMVGVAAGLATAGYLPFVVTFAVFAVSRVLDQVRMVVAQTGLPVTVVGAYAGILAGNTGKTHICVDDLAVYRAMPEMRVLAPGDGAEVRAAIGMCAADPRPTYLRVARDPVPTLPIANGEEQGGLRALRVLRPGGPVRMIATGVQSGRCLVAADLLHARGLDVGVVHLPRLKPVDATALRAALADAALVVSVEEHSIVGGLGSLVAEVLAAAPTKGHFERLGVRDTFVESGNNDALLDAYGLSPERVADAVERLWNELYVGTEQQGRAP